MLHNEWHHLTCYFYSFTNVSRLEFKENPFAEASMGLDEKVRLTEERKWIEDRRIFVEF